MATKSNQLRSRYGICLNDQCPLSKEKKIQEVVGRKEFVCSECGKPLKECRPPQSWWEKNGKKVIIAAVMVVVAAVGGYFGFMHKQGTTNPEPAPKIDSLREDSIRRVKYIDSLRMDSIKKEKFGIDSLRTDSIEKAKQLADSLRKDSIEKAKKPQPDGSINLGYGKYKGETKNGKPHGHGTITYTKRHKIISSKDFVANPGDRYEGEFRDGKVSGGMGYWYHDGDITAIKP